MSTHNIQCHNKIRKKSLIFFSAPVAKPLACCVNIISRPPSEIFFSYILRMQDFDIACKLEKICMKKVVVWKKKKRKKEKEKYHQFVIC